MSKQVAVLDQSYDDAKTKFVSLAKMLLANSYKVATEEKRPVLRIHIEGLVAELETFLADFDNEFDKEWKESFKPVSGSLMELVPLAEQVLAQGQALESVMDQTWPIRDDLNAFLSELTVVINLIKAQIDEHVQ